MERKIISIIILMALLFNFFPMNILAEELPTEDVDTTVIDTGNVDINADMTNSANQNENVVTGTDPDPVDEQAPILTLENENAAETENNFIATGTSGVNLIENSGEGDSYIYTGDINSDTSLENDVNGNVAIYECIDCDASTTIDLFETPLDENSTNTGDPVVTELGDQGDESLVSTTSTALVQNTNQATTTNNEEILLNSGDNEIASSNNAVIETGDIGIINVLINFINTNFFGNGKDFFINIFNKVVGSLDLSGFGVNPEGESDCTGENCSVTVNNNNQSTIDNSIVIDANTGQNLISGAGGQATISTGDIDIVNDVLNIANVNVSGDEWFFAVVNIFGELEGDVVLPSAYNDIENPESVPVSEPVTEGESRELIVGNENAGDLINEIVINANTGDNNIASSAEATIITGNAEIKSTIFNLINYNISGDTWKFARVNVFGTWEGIIEGLPPQYNYLQDENGITIYNAFLDDYKVDAAYAQMLVTNTNQATTTNSIEINAETGNNNILGSGESLINTGNVNIQNSLINFINSNFTGKNWEFSMVNVFGDWKGNLSFGQPELWVTESIDKASGVKAGDMVTYTFLFGNSGDALARNVRITDHINKALVRVMNLADTQIHDASVIWDLGDLPPNTQGSISYSVQVDESIPEGKTLIMNEVVIVSDENERNYSNNSSGGVVTASRLINNGNNSGNDNPNRDLTGNGSKHPNFSIIKTNNAEKELAPGDIVTYEIVIKNTGTMEANDVLVLDILRKQDENNGTTTFEEINRELWDFGTVKVGEEVTIEYSLEIKNAIETGIYNNEVMVEGLDPTNNRYIRAIASSKIKVINDEPIASEEEVAVLGYEAKPDLILRKVWPDKILYPGDVIEYQIVVKNNGDLEAYEVKVTEVLPPELRFVDNETSEKIMYLGDLAPGEESSLSLSAYVVEGAEPGEYTTNTTVSAYNSEEIKMVNSLKIEKFLADEVVKSEVLAETGFSLKEFLVLLLISLAFIGFRYILRKRFA